MALVTIDNLKLLLNVTTSDKDALLNLICNAADAAVKVYLRKGWGQSNAGSWPEQTTITEYYSGTGDRDIVLRYPPVQSVTSVYLDNTGFGGRGTNAFAAATLLTVGADYFLVNDDGTQSSSARLRRLSGAGSTLSPFQDDYWGPPGWPTFQTGGYALAGRKKPFWPIGEQNIKVVYVAGYASGSVPYDLQYAALELAVQLYNTRKFGNFQPSSEGLGAYNYSLMQAAQGMVRIGSIEQLLRRYRKMAI